MRDQDEGDGESGGSADIKGKSTDDMWITSPRSVLSLLGSGHEFRS